MAKDLDIRLRLDRAQAERSSLEFHEQEKRRINELIRADQDSGRARNATTGRLVAGMQSASEAGTRGFGAVHGAIEQGTSALERMIGRVAGTGALIGVVGSIADAWEQVRQNISRSAEEAFRYESMLREQTALVGKEQPGQVLPSAIDFQLQTRLPAEQANEFVKQFYGAVPAGIEKGNIDEATARQLAIAAGQTAARQGAAPGPRAELAGLLPMFGKIAPGPEGVRQGLGQLEAIRLGLTAGRGEDEPLTRELLGVAGSMVRQGGMLPSLPELSALIGVTSLSGGAMQAGNRVEQLVRGLMGSTPEQMKFVRGMGVDEHMNLEQRLDVMVPQLREVGKTRELQTYLTEQGMNAEQSRALVEVMGNYEILKDRMKLARGGAEGGGAAVEAANREFMAGDLGQQMNVQNLRQAATVMVGQRFKPVENIFGLAEADWIARGMDVRPDVAYGNILEGLLSPGQLIGGVLGAGQMMSPAALGRRSRIEQAAMRQLIDTASELGVDTIDVAGRAGGSFQERGTALVEAIREKGGDPYKGFDSQAVQDLLREQNDVLKSLDRKTANQAEAPLGGPNRTDPRNGTPQ